VVSDGADATRDAVELVVKARAGDRSS